MIAGYLPGPTTPNLQAGKMASTRETGRKFPSPGAARVAARAISLMTSVAVSLAGGGIGLAATRSHAGMASSGHRMVLMRAAAQEFRVPVRLLLAISYNQTRWERQGSAPSLDGGYGLMDLTAGTFPADDGGAGLSRPAPRTGHRAACGSGWHRSRPGCRPVAGVPGRSQRDQVRLDACPHARLEVACWDQVHAGAEDGFQVSLHPAQPEQA